MGDLSSLLGGGSASITTSITAGDTGDKGDIIFGDYSTNDEAGRIGIKGESGIVSNNIPFSVDDYLTTITQIDDNDYLVTSQDDTKYCVVSIDPTTKKVTFTTPVTDAEHFTSTSYGIVKIDTNKVLWVGTYNSTVGYAYANAGTISNGVITWGTRLSIGNDSNDPCTDVCANGTDKAIVAYAYPDGTSPYYQYIRTINISGTTITLGAAAYMGTTTDQNASDSYSLCLLTQDKAIVTYLNTTASSIESRVVNVSGTTITLGANTYAPPTAYANLYYVNTTISSSSFVLWYKPAINQLLVVGSVSGDVITFGSEATLSGVSDNIPGTSYPSRHNKIVDTGAEIVIFPKALNIPYNTYYTFSVSGTTITLSDQKTSNASISTITGSGTELFGLSHDTTASQVFVCDYLTDDDTVHMKEFKFMGFADTDYTAGDEMDVVSLGIITDIPTKGDYKGYIIDVGYNTVTETDYMVNSTLVSYFVPQIDGKWSMVIDHIGRFA